MKKLLKYTEPSIFEKFQGDTSIEVFNQNIPEDQWPQWWKEIHYKQYPRLPQIQLPDPQLPEISLVEVLKKRRSSREFSLDIPTIDEIGSLLFFSSGICQESDSTRFYPSAGKRYPLEMYLLSFNVSSLLPGLYHYNVQNHSFVELWKKDLSSEMFRLTNQKWVEKSNAVVILSSIFGRSAVKYSDRALRYCYIEAGHLAQNIYLLATSMEMACCAIGGFLDRDISEILDVDPKVESPLYMIAIGNQG